MIAEAARQYLSTWPRRARELVGLAGASVWREGYGPAGPDAFGYGFEAVVRAAELLGVGLVVQLADATLHARTTRPLTAAEWAFAKTYYAPPVLAKARLHTASATARRLRIAFVLGGVVKCDRVPAGPLLVHELCHVEQFGRWGWAYVAKCLWSQHRGAGYRYAAGALAQNLNAEQEAARREDGARLALGLPPRYAIGAAAL